MIERPAWAERLRCCRLESVTRWSQLRAVLAFEHKAAELNVTVPGHESLLRMLKGWERGDHTPNDLYRLVWSLVFDVPERLLFAELPPPPPMLPGQTDSQRSIPTVVRPLTVSIGGRPENLDPVENTAVTWATKNDITRFIVAESIFPPVLQLLRESR